MALFGARMEKTSKHLKRENDAFRRMVKFLEEHKKRLETNIGALRNDALRQMVKYLEENKKRFQKEIEFLQKSRRINSPLVHSSSTEGKNEASPLHLDDEDSSSLSMTPKSQLVEETIRSFSSPSKETSYAPTSPRKDLEKNEPSSNQEIGAFEKHTKSMGMKLM